MALGAFVSLCTAAAHHVFAGNGTPLAMLTAGLAGSVAHCAPMCGPFVLGQAGERLAALPAAALCQRQRVAAGLLLPYHAGRLTTYAGLGMLAALMGAGLGRLPWLGDLSGILLLLGALCFLLLALKRLAPGLVPAWRVVPGGWSGWVGRLARPIARTGWRGGYLFGLVLGFLPCGLLYGALAVAAATAEPGRGAVAMLAFGLGTVPSLVLVGIAGQAVLRRWRHGIALAGPLILGLDAVLLGLIGLEKLS